MRSELYINGTRVDLLSEFGCAITYAISDIKKPETRNGSFSKTIKLPATSQINQLLTYIFEISYDIQTSGVVNFAPDFNPNLKASAQVFSDGLLQINGYMRLMNIIRDQADLRRMYYEVLIVGEVATIYNDMADQKLSDLDLSAYNHSYLKQVQKATWTDTNYGTGYVYPMINYGGITYNTWDVNNFYPGIYAKTIVDAIFSENGWTYSSTFLTSSFFKRLFIPFSGEKLSLTSAQVASRLFAANLSAQTSGTTTNGLYTLSPVVYDTETSDPSSQYNTGTGQFTCSTPGYHDFYTSGTVTIKADTTVTPIGAATYRAEYTLWHYRGAQLISLLIMGTGLYASSAVTYTSGQQITSGNISGFSQSILLQTGDIVYVQLRAYYTPGSATGELAVVQSSGAKFFNRITNTAVVDGGTVDMASVLPTDVRQADFLTSIFRTFNLFPEPDRTQPNRLIIETEPDFYESGDTVNWTHKLHVGMPVTITPMGALDAIRYRVKYADDTDYWNKFYKDKWKETYGEKNIDVVNDFIKNTSVNEVIFAPTPIIGTVSNDRIIPEIYTLSNSGVQSPIRSKLRLLYWGGSKATVNSWSYTSATSGTTTETTYPYSGHVDDPISPTVDLSFGVPREVYYANPYGTTSYTNNNLYNQYHAIYIDEITDRNSKILTAYFRLTPFDIFTLSFRNIVFIDGHNYRLNRIFDYDPTSESVTKVELLKVKHAPAFVSAIKVIDGTVNDPIDSTRSDYAPTFGTNVGLGDVNSTSTNVNTGRDNYISPTSVGTSVSGSTNRVGNNTYNISIFSSSGVTVCDNCRNVTVIQSNDIVIREDDVTYVNGAKISADSDWRTISTAQTIITPGRYLVSGSITITISTTELETGDKFVFKKTDSGTTTSISGGGSLIDADPTYDLTTQWQSATLEFNTTQFYIT